MIATRALVLGIGFSCVAACSGAQSRSEAQLAAITAGCKVSLDLERDAGAAGAADESERGCEAALRTLDPVKPDGGAK